MTVSTVADDNQLCCRTSCWRRCEHVLLVSSVLQLKISQNGKRNLGWSKRPVRGRGRGSAAKHLSPPRLKTKSEELQTRPNQYIAQLPFILEGQHPPSEHAPQLSIEWRRFLSSVLAWPQPLSSYAPASHHTREHCILTIEKGRAGLVAIRRYRGGTNALGRAFYKGGFEKTMNRREAALILETS